MRIRINADATGELISQFSNFRCGLHNGWQFLRCAW